MGCWTVIKSFHVKIILLDKQELIQEIQVCTAGPGRNPRHTPVIRSSTSLHSFAHNLLIVILLVFALVDDNGCFARLINENQI